MPRVEQVNYFKGNVSIIHLVQWAITSYVFIFCQLQTTTIPQKVVGKLLFRYVSRQNMFHELKLFKISRL